MSKMRIPLIRPPVSYAQVESDFKKILESGMLTRGEYVEKFKAEIARVVTSAHAHLTTSATTALYASLKILGIGPGDEVAVSDFSFPATSNVVEEVGAKPVFIDVSLETFNMERATLESRLTSKTKAVIFVSAFGNPTGIHSILEFCRSKKIPLIDDAACAIGSSELGVPSGKIADLSCFSFHPRKVITTGEGGAITTENAEWSERLKRILNHGATVENGKWNFSDCGTNLRLTEIQAALGINQLKRLNEITRVRNEIRERYINALSPLGLIPQLIGKNAKTNSQSVVFRAPDSKTRDRLITHLSKSGIESTLGTYCLSGTSFNRKKYSSTQPIAERLEKETITLPCYEGMPLDEVLTEIERFF